MNNPSARRQFRNKTPKAIATAEKLPFLMRANSRRSARRHGGKLKASSASDVYFPHSRGLPPPFSGAQLSRRVNIIRYRSLKFFSVPEYSRIN